MKTNIMNNNGSVVIDEGVISKIAGLTAVECFGIVGMTTSGMRQGLTHILKKEHLTKGIKIHHVENQVVIDFHVIVSYGVSIAAVCQNLLNNVTYNIEKYTSIKVKKINVYVEGVRVID